MHACVRACVRAWEMHEHEHELVCACVCMCACLLVMSVCAYACVYVYMCVRVCAARLCLRQNRKKKVLLTRRIFMLMAHLQRI